MWKEEIKLSWSADNRVVYADSHMESTKKFPQTKENKILAFSMLP